MYINQWTDYECWFQKDRTRLPSRIYIVTRLPSRISIVSATQQSQVNELGLGSNRFAGLPLLELDVDHGALLSVCGKILLQGASHHPRSDVGVLHIAKTSGSPEVHDC